MVTGQQVTRPKDKICESFQFGYQMFPLKIYITLSRALKVEKLQQVFKVRIQLDTYNMSYTQELTQDSKYQKTSRSPNPTLCVVNSKTGHT